MCLFTPDIFLGEELGSCVVYEKKMWPRAQKKNGQKNVKIRFSIFNFDGQDDRQMA